MIWPDIVRAGDQVLERVNNKGSEAMPWYARRRSTLNEEGMKRCRGLHDINATLNEGGVPRCRGLHDIDATLNKMNPG